MFLSPVLFDVLRRLPAVPQQELAQPLARALLILSGIFTGAPT